MYAASELQYHTGLVPHVGLSRSASRRPRSLGQKFARVHRSRKIGLVFIQHALWKSTGFKLAID